MKMKIVFKGMCIFAITVMSLGCMSAQEHYEQTHGAQEREMTVGTVQREITKGMSGAQVAEVLGSPNIVTTDEEGREVWVYDKISTDVTYSQSSGGRWSSVSSSAAASGNTGGGGYGLRQVEAEARALIQKPREHLPW